MILRKASVGKTKIIQFDWNDIQKGKVKDIPLQLGDNIFIPKKVSEWKSPRIPVLPDLFHIASGI